MHSLFCIESTFRHGDSMITFQTLRQGLIPHVAGAMGYGMGGMGGMQGMGGGMGAGMGAGYGTQGGYGGQTGFGNQAQVRLLHNSSQSVVWSDLI